MPVILVILLVVVPVVELLIVLEVGGRLGAGWTVALLVAASLLGAYLLRVEGARTWRQFRRALEQSRWPGDEVAQGALVLVGGALLLTPGFLTDIVGFLFLLPPTRKVTARWLRRAVTLAGFRPFVVGSAATRAAGSSGRAGPRRDPPEAPEPPPHPTIEVVSVEREQPDEAAPEDHGNGDAEADPDALPDGR
jgi:UPF0716 protein FxsA